MSSEPQIEDRSINASQTLIEGKLSPPSQNVSLIDRFDLLDRMDSGLNKRLTLLQAAAGFGKTTLAAQWRIRQLARGSRVAWLTLDENDSEEIQFLSYLIAAFSRAGVEISRLQEASGKLLVEIPLKSAFTSMVAALTVDPVKTILILDDYERVQSKEVDQLLGYLLLVMPRNLHILLNTRDRPNLSLADMRAHGDLNELTFSDLRFSEDELRYLMEDTVNSENIHVLLDRTEGWPAAVQLLRIWLTDKRNDPESVKNFTGRTAEVAEYLVEQVLASMSDDMQEFSIKASILENLNGDLANAVCQRNDGWQIIDHLSEINSFLLPVDQERTWFRYHHLFSEFLGQLLVKRYKEDIGGLHLRASQWYTENNMLLEAVRHAHAGGAPELAVRLVEMSGGWRLLLSEGSAIVRNLLKQFGSDLRAFPRLELARILLMAKSGDITEARDAYEHIKKVSRNFNEAGHEFDPELKRDGQSIGLALDCYDDVVVSDSGLKRLHKLGKSIPQSDHYSHGAINSALAIASIGRGDFSTVFDCVQQSFKDMEVTGSQLGYAFSFMHQGLAHTLSGNLVEAKNSYLAGLEIAEQKFGSDSGPKAIADVLISEVYYQQNDLERASTCLQNSFRHVVEYDGWADIYITGYQIAIALSCAWGEYQNALNIIHEGEETAKTRGLRRLSGLLQAARYWVYVTSGNMREAQQLRDKEFSLQHDLWVRQPEFWRQFCAWGIAVAGHDISLSRPGPAGEVLAQVEQCCRSIGCNYYLIDVLLLKAIAAQTLGELETAGKYLIEALVLAKPQKFRRIFLDQKDIFSCIAEECLSGMKEDFENAEVLDFVNELLSTVKSAQAGKVDPISRSITEREMQILIQLGRGYSNKAIARTLGITENTVKYHLKNIYAKLGVAKRKHAIDLARNHSIIQ